MSSDRRGDLKYDFVCYYCQRAYTAIDLSHFDPADVQDPMCELIPVCVNCVFSLCLAEEEVEENE